MLSYTTDCLHYLNSYQFIFIKTKPNIYTCMGFRVVLVVKTPPANAGDIREVGPIPLLARSPGGGHGNPLQYSCLENLMVLQS